jgi:DNA-binding MarR family transcriptional regulator
MKTSNNSRRSNQFVDDNIVLSDRDASDTARLLKLLTGEKRGPVALMATRSEREESRTAAAERNRHSTSIGAAKQALISRRVRSQFIDASMFSEPGWDMLLALYITEESEARNSIARLTSFSGATPTTALRWITHLEELGLVCRVAHPTDLRTTFIELTAHAHHLLEGYFHRVEAMGLAA